MQAAAQKRVHSPRHVFVSHEVMAGDVNLQNANAIILDHRQRIEAMAFQFQRARMVPADNRELVAGPMLRSELNMQQSDCVYVNETGCYEVVVF